MLRERQRILTGERKGEFGLARLCVVKAEQDREA